MNVPSSTASLEDLKAIFDYDRNMSRDMEEVGLEQRDEISIRDISYAGYAGTSNRRVEVYLIEPPVTGPFAGVLFVHPGPRDRTSFLDEALVLAKMGMVSLLFNATWAYADDLAADSLSSVGRGYEEPLRKNDRRSSPEHRPFSLTARAGSRAAGI